MSRTGDQYIKVLNEEETARMKQVHIDHAGYQKKVRTMKTVQLLFIIQDAKAAIEAMPDGHKAGYYADEIGYCAMEIRRRRNAQEGNNTGA